MTSRSRRKRRSEKCLYFRLVNADELIRGIADGLIRAARETKVSFFASQTLSTLQHFRNFVLCPENFSSRKSTFEFVNLYDIYLQIYCLPHDATNKNVQSSARSLIRQKVAQKRGPESVEVPRSPLEKVCPS